jgi:large subunit ribosomal protein L5
MLGESEKVMEQIYVPRLKVRYRNESVAKLREEFGYPNVMQVPCLQKIILNVSMEDALRDVKLLESAAEELRQVTGQRPSIRRARRSVSNFKLREGVPIGVAVTLRRNNMWEFLDRLITVTIPRVRDFRGLNRKSFDGRGNYSMGLTEQLVFPEISYDAVKKVHGMNLTFVTSARSDAEGLALLKLLGMPFRKN